ncbi:MAG: methyltransferase domain-containing protein [Candidatus Riflebacteria bacterium]|nr:methyltransferase domain-containing protein [Candidatus Riflebacteria bacterium]
MPVSEKMRAEIIARVQGGVSLQIAYIGIKNNLFSALTKMGSASPNDLAKKACVDFDYVERWCGAAFAFGLLDVSSDGKLTAEKFSDAKFSLTELGEAFLSETPGSLMPFSVQALFSGHLLERASEFMPSGECPGDKVFADRPGLMSIFGPMLESFFVPVFEDQIFPNLPAYKKLESPGAIAIDFGCGNGWFLRRLASHFPYLKGAGFDGFAGSIKEAISLAEKQGFSNRLDFKQGDITDFQFYEKVDFISMNRVLHHVWKKKDKVFASIRNSLKPGGVAAIWEPNWPSDLSELRNSAKRFMASQNLCEHVQGNRFLRTDEIAEEFRKVGMKSDVFTFVNENEAVTVGTN